MATVNTNSEPTAAACDASLKGRAFSWATTFLGKQESVTVVLILILCVSLFGSGYVYLDLRADNREARADAVKKQEAAREEYLKQLAEERARSDRHAERTEDAIERFGEKVSASVDRLTDEIRRRPLTASH